MDVAALVSRSILRFRKLWRRPWFRWTLAGLGGLVVVAILAAAWLIRPFVALSARFAEHSYSQPSRLY